MKKGFALLVCIALLSGCALADQAVALPGSRYVVDVPDEMKYSEPQDVDEGVCAYISDTLEMDYLSYSLKDVAAPDPAESLQDRAKKLAEAGMDVQLRDVNGIGMIVYRVTDEADGAPGIGYVLIYGDTAIEVIFWYATQDAADTAKAIMESIRVVE